MTLLLDRRGLRIALGDDESAEHAAILARDVLPCWRAHVVAEADRAAGLGLGEEQAPAVLGHLDVVELRPALRIDAHGGPEVDVLRLEAVRAHLHPQSRNFGCHSSSAR